MSYNLVKFLKQYENEDLEPLIEFQIKKLSSDIEYTDAYISHNPDHRKYIKEIVKELSRFGGNTAANILRGGQGVLYDEIVDDVGSKVGAEISSDMGIEEKELAIIEIIKEKSFNRMSEKEKEKFLKEFGKTKTKDGKVLPYGLALAYIIAQIVVKKLVTRQIIVGGGRFVAGRTLAGVLGGPVIWVLAGIWAAFDIAGPAYSVTIPSVIWITYLRQKKKFEDEFGNMEGGK